MIKPIVIDVGEEIEYHARLGLPIHIVLLFCFVCYVILIIFTPGIFNIKTNSNPTGAFFGCVTGIFSCTMAIVSFWISTCYNSYKIYNDKYTIHTFKDRRIVELDDVNDVFELPIKKDVEIKANINYIVDYNICKVPIGLQIEYGPYKSKRIEIKHKGFFDVIKFTSPQIFYKEKGKKDD
jgi:uncharacterized membrane protein (DUF485 family)